MPFNRYLNSRGSEPSLSSRRLDVRTEVLRNRLAAGRPSPYARNAGLFF